MKEEKNISEVTQKLNNEEQTTNYEYAPNVNQITAAEVKEKVAGGILGAFLGTLIGAICIVLVNQFGYIASISGVVMGVCALKGYQILGKKMSLKGIIICVILILLMVYISNWFSYAVAVAQVYKADIVSSFLVVPELIKEGSIESGAYYKDLLMLYVFTAIGAVPVIKNQIKGK